MRKVLEDCEGDLVDVFSVLGDKNRFRIMKLLKQQGELCVSDLAAVLNVSVSAVSQHLRVLELARLVTCERMGQMVCYKPHTDSESAKKVISLV